MINKRRLIESIIYPPLVIGFVIGVLFGGSWVYDNHPIPGAIVLGLCVWGGWAAMLYEEKTYHGGS